VTARLRTPILGFTILLMTAIALPKVPRVWLDYSRLPLLETIPQPGTYGTDTIADMYEARVVLNDPFDMYTREKVEQTSLEEAVWSKEASAPYPPAALFVIAGLSAVGDAVGIGYYGMVLLLAVTFIGLSLAYFVQTRWYLFPLLYVNFGYLADRFVFVQDGSYLAMLVVVMVALWLARARRHSSHHVLMALATTMKLSPLYYVKHVFTMPARTGAAYVVCLAIGLVLPYFVLENYLSIYTYGFELRGSVAGAAASLAAAALFATLIAYVEVRLEFDWEERIGWALVPVAVFLALKLNAPRHLLLVLLVPDKRGLRNVAAAVAMLVPALVPSVRFGAAGPIAAVILLGGLVSYVRAIGWRTVRGDLEQPFRTFRLILFGRTAG